ncbi:hypothetical protein D1BOALGB6SA_2678 [Olavius sp. associated proteobacterium Delta 1]|nr:hypothetical protein D1BOALGB6SA_2678 [Olavius sp. associated proteobacterium Delta 1]
MPSDKKAICNLTHITPAPFAIYQHHAKVKSIRQNAPDKVRVILTGQLKQKGSQRLISNCLSVHQYLIFKTRPSSFPFSPTTTP